MTVNIHYMSIIVVYFGSLLICKFLVERTIISDDERHVRQSPFIRCKSGFNF